MNNPSNYGYTYSAEREAPPPEVGWIEKTDEDTAINLYSQNVVKDGDSTDSVDRESIANLGTTRRQWENLFSQNAAQTGSSDPSKKKKNPPKWEVKFPSKTSVAPPEPSTPPSSIPVTSSKLDSPERTASPALSDESHSSDSSSPTSYDVNAQDQESAIEREIRLAHEREEMLKAEKRERQKLMAKSQGITNYMSASAESDAYQPAYEELTEADRGSELWEPSNRYTESPDSASPEESPPESIIEREIRLQMEREAELRKQRQVNGSESQTDMTPSPSLVQTHVPEESPAKDQSLDVLDGNNNNDQEVDDVITRELRELKMREEEIQRMRGSQGANNSISHYTSYETERVPFHQHQATDNMSEHSLQSSTDETTSFEPLPSARSVKVKPLLDPQDEEDEVKTPYISKTTETPIEREMRIARERENELRRAKGLPELKSEEDDYFRSQKSDREEIPSNTHLINRPQKLGHPSTSMRKFASNRLQQEIEQQKERELALRSGGLIPSTAEDQQERIQPKKYMEVTGSEKAGIADVRNFVTSKRPSITLPSPSERPPDSVAAAPSRDATPSKGTATTSGKHLFSYKEFKQTAESKIERELREMREREEELRHQSSGN